MGVREQIATEFQLFETLEQKENFLFVLGALTARLVSLKKASELLDLDAETLLTILELLGIEFSYLTERDVAIEKNW